ncbi:MAG: hypothetical protein D6788_10955 [Planctomycetota bacterium]|nr:MAG: hypothetical protein D6788_10955 [Planctomycetota bacterium]
MSCLFVGWMGFFFSAPVSGQSQRIAPRADGTLADGGVYGPFDGTADAADWFFNGAGFEGAITLQSGNQAGTGLEHRVVFEYDLSRITVTPLRSIILEVTLRGAPVFPMPPADVAVGTYAADLLESLSDFSIPCERVLRVLHVDPFQPPTAYRVNLTLMVLEALADGRDTVGIRLQMAPNEEAEFRQAFLDASDSTPSTKPALVLSGALLGDGDGDGVLSLSDHLGLLACLTGPGVPVQAACRVFDLDLDGDVDLFDQAFLEAYRAMVP